MTIINRWSDHIDSPDNNPIYAGNPSNEVWTTKEEKRIRVGDMTDAHIRNCYKMVMGTHSEYWQTVFRMEMEKRGLNYDNYRYIIFNLEASKNIFSCIVIALRKQLSLSQSKFAALLGVTYSTVSTWEKGKHIPGTEILAKFRNKFGIIL